MGDEDGGDECSEGQRSWWVLAAQGRRSRPHPQAE